MSATATTWQDAVLAAGREQGIEALTAIAAQAVEQELPLLRDDPDLLAAARSSAASNIEVVVALLRGAMTLAELEPTPQAAAFARELARRNVPVAELGRAVRVAQRALWRWSVAAVHERVAEPDRLGAIEALTEAVMATGDVFGTQITERYAVERERWQRSADAVRRATVEELLRGDAVDGDAASARLRYELRGPHRAFVVWGDGDGPAPESVAAAVGGPGALLIGLGVGVIAGWSAPRATRPGSAAVAFGSPAGGVEGFRTSHREALEARRVALLLRRGGPVAYDDVALLALLTNDADQARAFAQRRLGALAGPDPATRRLADTLLAVREEQGSLVRAAGRLGVHPNTVAKRLRAIERLAGGPPTGPPAEVLCALLIRRVLD